MKTRHCQQYCVCVSAVTEKSMSGLVAGGYTALEGVRLIKEYLDLAEQYPTPMRMIRGHTFSLIGQYLCLPYDSMLPPGAQASSHVSCTTRHFKLFAVSVGAVESL